MATVPTKNLKANEVAELACTYAALILHDEGIDINGIGTHQRRQQDRCSGECCWCHHRRLLAQAVRQGFGGTQCC